MNILMLICNIIIPVLMIFIGILFKCNSYKKIDKTLHLIIPIAMVFNGFLDREKEHLCKNTNKLDSVNRKYGLIWSISGVGTLLFTMISLILNKSNIYNTSVTLLEAECLILVAVFVTVEYMLKRNFNKNY